MIRQYKAHILDVISGDDMIAMIDLGIDGLFVRKRIRLYGVDTPNTTTHDIKTIARAEEIRDKVKERIKDKVCIVEIHRQGRGGWVVTLKSMLEPGVYDNINDWLMKEGHVFDGPREEIRRNEPETSARQ